MKPQLKSLNDLVYRNKVLEEMQSKTRLYLRMSPPESEMPALPPDLSAMHYGDLSNLKGRVQAWLEYAASMLTLAETDCFEAEVKRDQIRAFVYVAHLEQGSASNVTSIKELRDADPEVVAADNVYIETRSRREFFKTNVLNLEGMKETLSREITLRGQAAG